ncbi:MAG TPA: Lpg1974 family pore-forming outer membrane protein [Gemmataceae bacterium]|jgi:hypothetical protein|nr:Lpg1974 family pore-forming outer membrane protein [Gemmataceae bacterium]
MSHFQRRWAFAALTAALFGTAVRAGDEIVLPAPPDVSTLPVVVIPAVAKPSDLPAPGEVKPVAIPDIPIIPTAAADPVPAPPTLSAAPTPPAPPAATFIPPPMPPVTQSSSSGVYAGAGLLYLKPYISNNAAFAVTTPPVPPGFGAFPTAFATVENQSFDWNAKQAFQIWGGWTSSSGWGIRADAFSFSHDSNAASLVNQVDPIAPRLVGVPGVIPFIPGAAGFGAPTAVLAGAGIGSDRMVFGSSLDIRTTDLEVTYQWAGDEYLLRLSAGGRWTSLRQGYFATLRNFGDGITTETQKLDFQQKFSGVGPTVGLYAEHAIGGGLSAYGSVRGSVLAGNVEQHAGFFQDISDPALVAFVGSQQTRTRFDNCSDHVLTVAELELGLEYAIVQGCSRYYARAGVVAQSYGNAGNATGTLGTLSLFGGQMAIGVNY